jgi:hypothetical protein
MGAAICHWLLDCVQLPYVFFVSLQSICSLKTRNCTADMRLLSQRYERLGSGDCEQKLDSSIPSPMTTTLTMDAVMSNAKEKVEIQDESLSITRVYVRLRLVAW